MNPTLEGLIDGSSCPSAVSHVLNENLRVGHHRQCVSYFGRSCLEKILQLRLLANMWLVSLGNKCSFPFGNLNSMSIRHPSAYYFRNFGQILRLLVKTFQKSL